MIQGQSTRRKQSGHASPRVDGEKKGCTIDHSFSVLSSKARVFVLSLAIFPATR